MAGRPERAVRGARRRHLRRNRQRHRQAGLPRLPADDDRVLPGRHRADRILRAPRRRRGDGGFFERIGELFGRSEPLVGVGRGSVTPASPRGGPYLTAALADAPYNSPVNQEVFAALAEALEAGRRGGARHDQRRPPDPPRSAWAPRCWSTPTAARSARSAAAATRTRRSGRRARRSQSRKPLNMSFELNDDFAQETGLVCGGQMEVFIEPVEASPELYVFGAGHVGYFVGEDGARGGLPGARRGRPREVRQHRALRRGHRRRRGRHPDLARSPPAAAHGLRRHRDPRPPPRPRRAAGAHGAARCATSASSAARPR